MKKQHTFQLQSKRRDLFVLHNGVVACTQVSFRPFSIEILEGCYQSAKVAEVDPTKPGDLGSARIVGRSMTWRLVLEPPYRLVGRCLSRGRFFEPRGNGPENAMENSIKTKCQDHESVNTIIRRPPHANGGVGRFIMARGFSPQPLQPRERSFWGADGKKREK